MQLDAAGKWHLFGHIRAKGYTGTAEEWVEELRRQGYAADVRDFCASCTPVALYGYPELQQWVADTCLKVFSGFECVHTSCSGHKAGYISFTNRLRPQTKALRLQQLTMDIYIDEEMTTVKIRGYVNGKVRLNRSVSVPFKLGGAA